MKEIQRGGFDLVHIQYTPELFGRSCWMKLLPLLLALRRGPKVVTTPHTLVGGYASAKVLAPLLVGFSQRIICPNEEVYSLISRRLPLFRSRLRSIPIGSSISPVPDPARARDAVREELALPAEVLLLSHFGFAYPGKGQETLLSAARHLREDGISFRLLMIGGVWPEAPEYYRALQDMSRKAGLDHHVCWLGHCDRGRVASLLAASDICLLPYDDGISLRRSTLLAGIVQRLPIVSTVSGRPSRWFHDGENVMLVPPKNPRALATAVETIVRSPDLRGRLHAGAASLADQFGWPRIAEQTLAVYRELSS
jgi:glycosyltransferase involved in cell wall biosynthesis